MPVDTDTQKLLLEQELDRKYRESNTLGGLVSAGFAMVVLVYLVVWYNVSQVMQTTEPVSGLSSWVVPFVVFAAIVSLVGFVVSLNSMLTYKSGSTITILVFSSIGAALSLGGAIFVTLRLLT